MSSHVAGEVLLADMSVDLRLNAETLTQTGTVLRSPFCFEGELKYCMVVSPENATWMIRIDLICKRFSHPILNLTG